VPIYPVASSGPDDDVYTVGYPDTSDPSGKTLRESGRKILNMAKPKTVPKKFIKTAEGTRPRMRTRIKKGKIDKIRAARESAFLSEVAPPGREDQVKALKKKVGVPGAFKIAWADYNKESKAREGGPGSGRHAGGEDSRHLFDDITNRKASSWGEVESHMLTPEQHSAFKTLPRLDMSSLKTPMQTHPALKADKKDGREPRDIEYHGVRGKDHYYVNTEGYDYPRYVAHVKGAAIE
jgi:hypothetical protein